jgi:hypothetical protein
MITYKMLAPMYRISFDVPYCDVARIQSQFPQASIVPVGEREIELQPRPFINVFDCEVSLAFFIPLDTIEVIAAFPTDELTPRERNILIAAVERQGGAVNMSGWYEVDSEAMKIVESVKVQEFLKDYLMNRLHIAVEVKGEV